MSLEEKLANSQTTNWLSHGLSKEEILKEKKLALIAYEIEQKRNSLGMSQKQFADHMGVTQGMVSKWEGGSYNFTITTLMDICTKLNLEFTVNINEKAYEEEYKEEKISSFIFVKDKPIAFAYPTTDNHNRHNSLVEVIA